MVTASYCLLGRLLAKAGLDPRRARWRKRRPTPAWAGQYSQVGTVHSLPGRHARGAWAVGWQRVSKGCLVFLLVVLTGCASLNQQRGGAGALRARDQARLVVATSYGSEPTTAALILAEMEQPETVLAGQLMLDLSKREIALEELHAGFIFAASFSPDDARVLTSSLDGTARVWDRTAPENPVASALMRNRPGLLVRNEPC